MPRGKGYGDLFAVKSRKLRKYSLGYNLYKGIKKGKRRRRRKATGCILVILPVFITFCIIFATYS